MCDRLRLLSRDVAYLVTELAVPICDVVIRDNKGKTALDIAREKGFVKIVEYLMPMMDIADTTIVNHSISPRSTQPRRSNYA